MDGGDTDPTEVSRAKMKAFALKRGLPVTGDRWEQAVIFAAASEHPELDPNKRKPGRPKKDRLPKPNVPGLLGDVIAAQLPEITPEAAAKGAELLNVIAAKRAEIVARTGLPASVAAGIREYVSDLGYDVHHWERSAKIERLAAQHSIAKRALAFRYY